MLKIQESLSVVCANGYIPPEAFQQQSVKSKTILERCIILVRNDDAVYHVKTVVPTSV